MDRHSGNFNLTPCPNQAQQLLRAVTYTKRQQFGKLRRTEDTLVYNIFVLASFRIRPVTMTVPDGLKPISSHLSLSAGDVNRLNPTTQQPSRSGRFEGVLPALTSPPRWRPSFRYHSQHAPSTQLPAYHGTPISRLLPGRAELVKGGPSKPFWDRFQPTNSFEIEAGGEGYRACLMLGNGLLLSSAQIRLVQNQTLVNVFLHTTIRPDLDFLSNLSRTDMPIRTGPVWDVNVLSCSW
ncbi:hypothetical protein CROQUDRAFT_85880 [Cronartium quercuum f. sp. fusiforme G11]|uniref:Uncharacterized protein n=1 Tax=Cronartium quercuum f. sp. fusiforme G11 TaxID=708437 RepID=A0A9P6NZB4_9BASI|nr:hypothetical protein CROQUDRAFT_85880 [Cronartium quercuum f. sp. fusiforme G11]